MHVCERYRHRRPREIRRGNRESAGVCPRGAGQNRQRKISKKCESRRMNRTQGYIGRGGGAGRGRLSKRLQVTVRKVSDSRCASHVKFGQCSFLRCRKGKFFQNLFRQIQRSACDLRYKSATLLFKSRLILWPSRNLFSSIPLLCKVFEFIRISSSFSGFFKKLSNAKSITLIDLK